jgi:hypothetical protein
VTGVSPDLYMHAAFRADDERLVDELTFACPTWPGRRSDTAAKVGYR